jgi:5-methylcytosine-specific restriction endonuclease McrA
VRMGRHARKGNHHRTVRGETPADARVRIRRRGRRSRAACVAYVRDRDHHCCRLCGRPVQYRDDRADDFGQVHEYVPRAAGGSDTEPTNTVLVCQACHTGAEPCLHPPPAHQTQRRIVPLDADALMEGPIVADVVPLGPPELETA